jgi:hypothetical protein
MDSIYNRVFDKEHMQDLFGTQRPDLSERTRVFFDLWREWQHRAVKINNHRSREIREIMLSMGLREHFEFQIRNGELRCYSDEALAMASLKGLDQYRS